MHQNFRPGIYFISTLLFLLGQYFANAQEGKNNLNKALEFHAGYILYKGKKITPGPKSFYMDGQLTQAEATKYPYVFNLVNEAANHVTDGTIKSPMGLNK